MTQLILTIEDANLVPHLKKILQSIKGVTVKTNETLADELPTGLQESFDDLRNGRVFEAENADALIADCLSE